MKIFQNDLSAPNRVLGEGKVRAGGALAVCLSLIALSGCSANSEPAFPFVESANADTMTEEQNGGQSLVNISQDDEKFSQAELQRQEQGQGDLLAAGSRDFSPITQVVGQEWTATGEPVTAINPAQITPNTSWQYTHYINYPLTVNGKATVGHKATLGTGFSTLHESQVGFDACGGVPVTQSIIDELRYPPAAPEACSLKDIESKFYQSNDDFAVEYYCDDQLVSARHYQKIADEKVSFYRLEFSQLTPTQDYSDTDACVEITNYWNALEAGEVNTVADIYGSILRDSYHLQMQLNHIKPQQSFFTLDETAGEQTHDFVFNFKPFGRYSSTQKESGFILWERSPNPLKMRAEFEVLIDDVVAGERQLEGFVQANW